MRTSLVVAGVVMVIVGVLLFGAFVIPQLSNQPAVQAVLDISQGPPTRSVGLVLAVLGAAMGLAGGCALIGIGIGHWKRPLPSRVDGTPEV